MYYLRQTLKDKVIAVHSWSYTINKYQILYATWNWPFMVTEWNQRILKPMIFKMWSSGPATASPGNLLEKQILRSHRPTTESKTVGAGSRNPHFTKTSRWFRYMLMFRNLWFKPHLFRQSTPHALFRR